MREPSLRGPRISAEWGRGLPSISPAVPSADPQVTVCHPRPPATVSSGNALVLRGLSGGHSTSLFTLGSKLQALKCHTWVWAGLTKTDTRLRYSGLHSLIIYREKWSSGYSHRRFKDAFPLDVGCSSVKSSLSSLVWG